jgi:hypothetical protein
MYLHLGDTQGIHELGMQHTLNKSFPQVYQGIIWKIV